MCNIQRNKSRTRNRITARHTPHGKYATDFGYHYTTGKPSFKVTATISAQITSQQTIKNMSHRNVRYILGLIDWAGFNVQLNTLWVISGTGFYGSNETTNSAEALKEVVVLRIGFNSTRSTSPCYNTTHACNVHKNNTYTKMNLSTVKWAQWDKTQSRELLVCSYVCALHCAQLLHTILHWTDLIIFPLTLQTTTMAPMMSIWGKGKWYILGHIALAVLRRYDLLLQMK